MRSSRGFLRILLGSLSGAIGRPRLLLLGWALVTVPALFAVAPAYAALDAALSQHPGASFVADGALDADLGRLEPETGIRLHGALAFALLAWAILAGGVLATADARASWRDLLAACGAYALRSLRVLVIVILLALLLGWGCDWLDALVRERWADADPGPYLSVPWFGWAELPVAVEAIAWGRGFLFLLLLFLGKVALARIVCFDRGSALLAFAAAIGTLLRHPLRLSLTVSGLALVWLLGSHLIGMGTVHLLEVRHELWLGLATGQAGVLWGQVVLVAFLLAAREFVPEIEVVPSESPRTTPTSA